MQKLHPKAFWLFFLQKVLVLLFMTFFLFGPMLFGFGVSFWAPRSIREAPFRRTRPDDLFKTIYSLSLYGTLGFLFFVLVTSFIWAKLYYESFKFELVAKGLKIESGVIWKKYVTIPYERIQNVDIYRGPLARILGLSDIHVQTAGIAGAMVTEGRIPGLSPKDAEEMREKLVDKIGGDQGL